MSSGRPQPRVRGGDPRCGQRVAPRKSQNPRQTPRRRPPWATTGWPGRQDKAPRWELLADSGPGPGAATSPLVEKPAAWTVQHAGKTRPRVGWTSRLITPNATHIA